MELAEAEVTDRVVSSRAELDEIDREREEAEKVAPLVEFERRDEF